MCKVKLLPQQTLCCIIQFLFFPVCLSRAVSAAVSCIRVLEAMLPLTKKHRKLWGLAWLHSTILRRSLHHDVCLRALSYFILFIFINQAASFIMDSLYCPSVSKALDKDCGAWWWVWFKHSWSWDFDVLSHWSSDQDRALCGRSARLHLEDKHHQTSDLISHWKSRSFCFVSPRQ